MMRAILALSDKGLLQLICQRHRAYFDYVLNYFIYNGNATEIDNLLKVVKEGCLSDEVSTMGNIAEYLEERGRQQGMQQGMQQGVQEGIYAVAKKMLQDGVELTVIMKYTGLDKQVLCRLKNQLKQTID